MSTSNFWSQSGKGYKLYVVPSFYPGEQQCLECDYAEEGGDYENCGYKGECASTNQEWFYGDAVGAIDRANDQLKYHKIELKSGYYDGVQLFVVAEHDDEGIESMDNTDAWYYFDMCRSKAIRAWKADKNLVNKVMKELAKELGMIEIRMVARFSNGEALYEKVGA